MYVKFGINIPRHYIKIGLLFQYFFKKSLQLIAIDKLSCIEYI